MVRYLRFLLNRIFIRPDWRNDLANVSKVTYNGTALIDLTADTVTADALLKGKTAHSKNGTKITGTLTMDFGSITGNVNDNAKLKAALDAKASASDIKFSNISGNVNDNAKLKAALDAKVSQTELQAALNSVANNQDLQNALSQKVSTSAFQAEINRLNDMAYEEDAPDDGHRYVRKHGVWMLESISGSSGSGTFDISDLGALATKDYIEYQSNFLRNKPVLGNLASQNISVSQETLIFS